HYSVLPILVLLIFFHGLLGVRCVSLGIKLITVLVGGLLASLVYMELRRYLASGVDAWDFEYNTGKIVLFYFLAYNVVALVSLFNCKKYICYDAYKLFMAIIFLSCFSWVVAFMSGGGHLDIVRTMHASYLGFCFVVPTVLLHGKDGFRHVLAFLL